MTDNYMMMSDQHPMDDNITSAEIEDGSTLWCQLWHGIVNHNISIHLKRSVLDERTRHFLTWISSIFVWKPV